MKKHLRKILSLSPLYDFVIKHRSAGDDAWRLRVSRIGKEYCDICKEITEPIDEERGFYLWGRYDHKRSWHSIYLGMAGFKKDKTNLRRRIVEELKDERAFVWRFVRSEAEDRQRRSVPIPTLFRTEREKRMGHPANRPTVAPASSPSRSKFADGVCHVPTRIYDHGIMTIVVTEFCP